MPPHPLLLRRQESRRPTPVYSLKASYGPQMVLREAVGTLRLVHNRKIAHPLKLGAERGLPCVS